MKPLWAVGLMSGTSLDGVDAALIETDGERVFAFGPSGYRAYAPDERGLLRQALQDAADLRDRRARPGILAAAEALITRAHAEAVESLLAQQAWPRERIGVVGFHGQTVLHRPDERLTVQIGDGRALAARLAVPVVYGLRAADVAAGGQGAPLVPIFHAALAQTLDRPRPLMVLNVGGVSNITYVDNAGALIACDTGPGNALLDDFMLGRTGANFDEDGHAAAAGAVYWCVIERILSLPFFAQGCPKSLDRNAFSVDLSHLSTNDGAATLTALSAAAVGRIVCHLPAPPRACIVAGGGARNPTMLRMVAEQLPECSVETAASVGWSGDALEAQAFAFLAVRSLRGLPITFPSTTGVPAPLSGGVVTSQPQNRTAC